MLKANALTIIVLALLVIGGLNWGLVGLFQFDLVAALFGEMSALSRVVYTVVGVCAVLVAIMAFAGGKPAAKAPETGA